MIVELVICLISTVVIYYWYTYKKMERFFEERKVKYLPGWPLFGNTMKSTLQIRHMFYDIDEVYKAFPDEKYVGLMETTRPNLIIRDPELIKLITVKDFDHFTDHKHFISEHLDPLFGTSLFQMKGEKWRDMRSILSPAFTGSKIKFMMQFMIDISNYFVEYLKEHSGEVIDVDDLMRRYTNDVIASTSFGLEVNSLKDRNNEFYVTGQNVVRFTIKQMGLFLLDDQFPSLVKKLGIKLYPEKTYTFFKNLISETLEFRKKNKFHRPDMLQLLLETPKEWTVEELCAQAFIFFSAGYETSASVLVMTVHELTLNPEIQEKLYQEIRTFKEALGNNEITSDSLNSINYLDCIVNETLRKWSPAIIADRKCVKTYTLPPANEGGKPYVLNPGDIVYNSANSLHLDPVYWPDPMKYDPDRWLEENRHNIKPFTFHPFGLGPRICIGSRFAILEIKILLYYLVLNFKMVRCAKTVDNIELINNGFHIMAKGGTWVTFEERI